jgi:hypothetical protein
MKTNTHDLFYLMITVLVIAIVGTYLTKESYIQSVFGQSNNNSFSDANNTIMNNSNEIEENENEVLGIVKNGTFIVTDSKKTLKLTGAFVMEAISPEAKLINLTEYEGKAILVSYHHIDDEWIWAAAITDIADPIVTKVVKELFKIL